MAVKEPNSIFQISKVDSCRTAAVARVTPWPRLCIWALGESLSQVEHALQLLRLNYITVPLGYIIQNDLDV